MYLLMAVSFKWNKTTRPMVMVRLGVKPSKCLFHEATTVVKHCVIKFDDVQRF